MPLISCVVFRSRISLPSGPTIVVIPLTIEVISPVGLSISGQYSDLKVIKAPLNLLASMIPRKCLLGENIQSC